MKSLRGLEKTNILIFLWTPENNVEVETHKAVSAYQIPVQNSLSRVKDLVSLHSLETTSVCLHR